MVFSSMIFIWKFLPVVFCANFFLNKFDSNNKTSNIFLLFASLFFYAWGEPHYIILMLCCITVNWLAGLLLETATFKRAVLLSAVVANLGILGYYKYASMAIDTLNVLFGTKLAMTKVSLPIGISFFTFQGLSYVLDVYKGTCATQRSWFKLALYISFFPQLIAGPIVKYQDINQQIDQRAITLTQTALGIRRFTYGFAKKVLLANTFGFLSDQLYALQIDEVTCAMAWITSIAYTLQIYYDFSGYSDMAIGLGYMFGFQFKENFNYPYRSHSIREFWQRWHISLGSWFREYVYFPLGGNRNGNLRTYLNLTIVFLLTGIWHGASWTFVFWGLYHGFFSIIERLWLGRYLKRYSIFSLVYTLLIVNFGWIFFRVERIENSLFYIIRMLQPWKYRTSSYFLREFIDLRILVLLGLGILGAGIIKWIGEWGDLQKKWIYSIPEMFFCTGIFFLSLMSLAGNTYNPFIYFRF